MLCGIAGCDDAGDGGEMSFVNCELLKCINNADGECHRLYVNLDSDGQCEDYVEDEEGECTDN